MCNYDLFANALYKDVSRCYLPNCKTIAGLSKEERTEPYGVNLIKTGIQQEEFLRSVDYVG